MRRRMYLTRETAVTTFVKRTATVLLSLFSCLTFLPVMYHTYISLALILQNQ